MITMKVCPSTCTCTCVCVHVHAGCSLAHVHVHVLWVVVAQWSEHQWLKLEALGSITSGCPILSLSANLLPCLQKWMIHCIYECSSTGGCYHWCSSTGGCYHQCSSTVWLLSLVLQYSRLLSPVLQYRRLLSLREKQHRLWDFGESSCIYMHGYKLFNVLCALLRDSIVQYDRDSCPYSSDFNDETQRFAIRASSGVNLAN